MSTSKNSPSEGTDGAKAPHENGSAAVNGESDRQEVNGKAVTDTTDAGDTSKFSRLDSSTIKLEHGYETLLREQRQRMPKLPDIPVSFSDLTHKVEIPIEEHGIPNVFKAAVNTFKWISPTTWWSAFQAHRKKDHVYPFYPISNCTGTLHPGTMTLLVAPPGHGKSTLLRALAGRLDSSQLEGEIYYDGKPEAELSACLEKLVAHVDQVDVHLPFLTVRETLQFALDSSVVSGEEVRSAGLQEAIERRVDTMLKLLGLEECADTLVGNELVKGLSGGQKKRVTIGEMLITNARVFLLDEVTTGLDSAVAFDIMNSIKKWCKELNGTVLASLLQPPPDVYNLFDDLMLMREGRIIYHGKRERVCEYLSHLGVDKREDEDEADFLTKFTTDPNDIKKSHGCRDDDEEWDTDFLVQKWNELGASFSTDAPAQSKADEREVTFSNDDDDLSRSNFLVSQYTYEYSQSFFHLTKLCVLRQFRLMFRNAQFIGSRFGQAAFIGLVLGSLFWDLPLDDFSLKIGVLTFSIIFLSFANLAEIPVIIEQRQVVQKQSRAKFYPFSSYTFSAFLTHAPIAATEVVILGSILYWMTGLSEEAGRFFFFLFLLFCASMTLGTLFRIVSVASTNMEVAQSQGGPVIGAMLLFGGFLITRENIPIWLRWLYWLSPFSWSITSLMQNEVGDEKYDVPVRGSNKTLGELGLENYDVPSEDAYQWGAIGILLGYFVLFSVVMTLIIKYKIFDPNIGSTRIVGSEESNSNATTDDNSVSQSSKMPFTPLTLAFNDIKYDVQLPSKEWKRLLRGISGVAKPGKLTSLMGVSGSGKTTLMDVLLGRKTSGNIEGDIFVNGYPKNDKYFRRITGYVEQFDYHMPYCTVAESLSYAAQLRLPPSITAEQQSEFVEEVLRLMELNAIRDNIVGVPGEVDGGLSPGERKRLTIAVELVANPSIIFLDEPTTGLDSRAAMGVMRVIKRIVNTGRTVVCTVHQPSYQLFSLFDEIILLQRGGHQVYAGPLGEQGKDLIEYFESAGAKKASSDVNPADWVLSVLLENTVTNETGEDVVDQEKPSALVDFASFYANSELKKQSDEEVQRNSEASGTDPFKEITSQYPQEYSSQFSVVLRRTFLNYWRNVAYNWIRTFVLALNGLLFGILFYDIAEDATDVAGVLSAISLVFLAVGFAAVSNYSSVLPVMSKERAIYYRERSSNMYASWIYSLSLTIVEIPFSIFLLLFFVCIYYFLGGFSTDAGVFFHYIFIHFLSTLTLIYLGMFFSAAFPDVETAQIFGSVFITMFFLFGGVFISKPEIPDGWIWFYYINPVAYATNVMASLQFYCEGDDCPTIEVVDPDQGVITRDRYEFVHEEYGFDYDRRWEFTGYLAIMMVIIRVLGVLSLGYINHMKR